MFFLLPPSDLLPPQCFQGHATDFLQLQSCCFCHCFCYSHFHHSKLKFQADKTRKSNKEENKMSHQTFKVSIVIDDTVENFYIKHYVGQYFNFSLHFSKFESK